MLLIIIVNNNRCLTLMAVNDMCIEKYIISIILFADDTNVFYSHTSIKKPNEIMQTETIKYPIG